MNNPVQKDYAIHVIEKIKEFAEVLVSNNLEEKNELPTNKQWASLLFLCSELGFYGRVEQVDILEKFTKRGGCPGCMLHTISTLVKNEKLSQIQAGKKTIISL